MGCRYTPWLDPSFIHEIVNRILLPDTEAMTNPSATTRQRFLKCPTRVWLVALQLFLLVTLVTGQDLTLKVSLDLPGVVMSKALEAITRESGIEFSYNPGLFNETPKITLRVRQKPVSEVLDQLLKGSGYDYRLVGRHVVITAGTEAREPAAAKTPQPVRRYTVSGFVKDKGSGEVLIGANVLVGGTTQGVVSNGYGFYSLTLPAGNYLIGFSYLGYTGKQEPVSLGNDLRLNAELDESPVEIGEVEIVAGDETAGIRDNQMSDFRFNQRSLSAMPGFAGNLDVIRALQAVPGIQSFGDGSALYFVRGGSSDQNLMLLDEVPVYNPSHLFGFFSAFSPDAINEVTIYKGDFPARFGGRLSSVIDIKAREGNMKHFGFSGNVGPYSTSLTAEGPLVRDRGSFFLSGRVSTVEWLNALPPFTNRFDFRFFDINAKLNYRLNENNRLFLTLYTGNDLFGRYATPEVNAYDIRWNNVAGTLRWNHLFSSRLFSNTTLNYSRYRYSLTLPQEREGSWISSIGNLTLKSDLSWYLNTRNTLRSGVEVTWHQTDPGNVTLVNGDKPADVPEVSRYQSMEYLFYASNEQKIGKKLRIHYGLRLPVWQDVGPSTIYYFDANHRVIDTISYGGGETYSVMFSPEPRLGICYSPDDRSSLKASYSRTSQFLQMLSNSTSPFTSLDVWVPAGPNIEPRTADQVAVGYSRIFPKRHFVITAEGYYKWFHDHLDYSDHANLLYNPLIEGELRTGKAWSYGIELMVRKTTGRFTGWIGYTWSRALVQTPGINGGNTYPATHDRPHNVSVNLAWDDQRHWALSATWIYLTGAATSTPVGFYTYNGYRIPVYGEKNNDRLPDYHRLDLSAVYTFNKPGNRYRHSLAVTIYNAYGRLNPFSENFNKMAGNGDGFVVPGNLYGSYELLPTTLSVAGIIPSINYKFRF